MVRTILSQRRYEKQEVIFSILSYTSHTHLHFEATLMRRFLTVSDYDAILHTIATHDRLTVQICRSSRDGSFKHDDFLCENHLAPTMERFFPLYSVFELDNTSTGCGDDTGISVSARTHPSLAVPCPYHRKPSLLLSRFKYSYHVGF